MPPTYFPLRWESTGDQWWYASPIDWAAANGHYDLVRELLRLDSNHLIKLSSLRRIRRLEVVWDDEEQFDDVAKNRSLVAQKLLHEGDNKKGKNSLIGSGYGGWLLYTAASAGDLPFVQELLHKDPLLVFGEGEYGVTDILYAAARSKNAEAFRLIYDFAMSPRFMSSNGREFEEHLGEIPAAYKQEMKNRAVHALARGGNLDILKELLGDCTNDQILAYRDIQGSTILHTAAGRGQVEVVKYLVSSYEIINSSDKEGNTALHIAASRGHISVVDILIKASPSSIHSKNNGGETFLHTAVTGFQTPTFRRLDRQIVLMKQLICSKAFNIEEIINATNHEGRTALHLAIHGNIDSDLVELLMTVCSINVNKRDNHGMTPLDLLKQHPKSASSEVLTRQLISAGAILSNQDYNARKILASHLRKGSAGGSPGTTFNVADSEIFLHSGTENTPSTACATPVLINAAEVSQVNSNSNMESKSSNKKKKHKGIKRFLRWPKARKTGDEGLTMTTNSKELPVPLRQRFSKPSSPSNNKRTLAARSTHPSPTATKKLASGLVNGVMQAMPHINRRSRSNSFSRSSISSLNSHTGIDMSCSNQMPDDGIAGFSNKEQGVVTHRRSVNQYFCFGASKLPLESPRSDQHQHEIYDRYVLSTA